MPHPRVPEIDGQRGFATTSQLLAAGWTYSALSHLVAATGSRVLPRVYLPHQSHVAADDITVAGWLWAGSSERMRLVASSPSISGMCTSISTTS